MYQRIHPHDISGHKAFFHRYDCLLCKKNDITLNVVIRHLNSLGNLNQLQPGMFEAVLPAFWNKWHWALHMKLQLHRFLCMAWLLRSLYSKLFPIWSLITKGYNEHNWNLGYKKIPLLQNHSSFWSENIF